MCGRTRRNIRHLHYNFRLEPFQCFRDSLILDHNSYLLLYGTYYTSKHCTMSILTMIKLSSSITTWKSSNFTYPVYTGSNGGSIYFNHGMNQQPASYSITLLHPNGTYLLHDFDRSSTNLYGYLQSGVGSDLNTIRVDIKRGPDTQCDAYARLVFYK